MYNLWKLTLRGHLNTIMSKRGSNSEPFAHENDALTARPQLHLLYILTVKKDMKKVKNINYIFTNSYKQTKTTFLAEVYVTTTKIPVKPR